jgi:hypothetical protein
MAARMSTPFLLICHVLPPAILVRDVGLTRHEADATPAYLCPMVLPGSVAGAAVTSQAIGERAQGLPPDLALDNATRDSVATAG